MSDEFETWHRTLLAKLFHAAQIKTSPTSFLMQIHRHSDQKTSKSLQKLMEDIARCDSLANLVYTQKTVNDFRSNKPPAECLKLFLSAYHNARQQRLVKKNSTIEPIPEDEEHSVRQMPVKQPTPVEKAQLPPTTHSDAITPNNLAEISKKIKKAATDGLSKSAQTSAVIENAPNPVSHSFDAIRPHSRWYFNKESFDSLPQNIPPPSCAALPISDQERLLINDLLYMFLGIAGDYITPLFTAESESGFAPVKFKVSSQVDISLRNITEEILPMAGQFSVVQKFAQWGSRIKNEVLQALSEILQEILHDYRLSIAQLETQHSNNELNLQKLLYMVRPNMQTLDILTAIAMKISKSNLLAGNILSMLFDEITLQTGDSRAQGLIIDLTERASIPYIEMLERWILKGVIIDRHNQFFVIDHGIESGNQQIFEMANYDTARYWECRYTIQPDRIPRFLENDADIILRTGKYLNVISQCGKQITPLNGASKLEFSAKSQSHSMFIKRAYHNASKTLLELLVNENNLMGHITSVKRYFLLQQGDLITQFMDASEDELSKHVDKVAPVRLNNLLQLIIRLSSAKHDPCIEHLHCDLFTMDLLEQMSKIHVARNNSSSGNQFTHGQFANLVDIGEEVNLNGLECFAFKYNVQWPVSLVLNQWALSQYQMLFRFLFYCKHVERQLCKIWSENSETSKRSKSVQKVQLRTMFALRQRMLGAFQHIESYMMIEVIEPNWNIFTEKMKNVQNIDDVMAIHQDFLHVCLENCMLNHPELLRSVMGIGATCLKFCKFIQAKANAELPSNWQAMINSYSMEFDAELMKLLNGINDMSTETLAGAKLINLVCRINFNGYYTDVLDQNGTKNNIAKQ